MTGFARAVANVHDMAIVWEIRSVNGKSLEARLRLPPGFDRLDQPCRQALQKTFSRGNLQATLNVTREAASGSQIVVNEAFLTDLAGLAQRLQEQFGAAPATADGLLALRGVLDVTEEQIDEETQRGIDGAVLACLDDAIAKLREARLQEGAALGRLLSANVDAVADCTSRAEADPSRQPDAIRERLALQVRLLTETGAPLDEARLHMEAAFLATKADIREELDRLHTHVTSARAMLAAGGVVGRRLDFLSQEFNREANTLCSKSNAATITAIGLELKTLIDQFREQVQNLE